MDCHNSSRLENSEKFSSNEMEVLKELLVILGVAEVSITV